MSLRPPLPHLLSATIFHLPFGETWVLTLNPILERMGFKKMTTLFSFPGGFSVGIRMSRIVKATNSFLLMKRCKFILEIGP
jgi:hypothetical protein